MTPPRASRLAALAAVLLGAVALPGSAAGSLGGAPAPDFVSRPSLQSVTLTGTAARWCFDRTLERRPLKSLDFTLGGYGAAVRVARPSGLRYADGGPGSPAGSCVSGGFAGTPSDLRQFTIGLVSDDAVRALGGESGNVEDAAPLSGSGGRTGTRGHTAGPDLIGAGPTAGGDAIAYVFDQPVGQASDPSAFHVYTVDGGRRDGIAATVTGALVTVRFDPPPAPGAGTEAFVDAGAVVGATAPGPLASAALAGGSPASFRPLLANAALSPAGNFVDFTFSRSVGTSLDAGRFSVVLADGRSLTGTSASLVTDATVRVEFSGLALVSEYVVRAAAGAGAAVDAVTTDASGAGGVPVGSRPEGVAAGFTTGAELLGVASGPDAGSLRVRLDQRVFSADRAGFRLLDRDGDDLGGARSATILGQGREAEVRFAPRALARAVALQLQPGSVLTALGTPDAGNVPQVTALAP